ncbi:hypothetical protein [Leifsonia naganoensis]|uniref:DNA-binding protein n=1 Tax=Leifsonia naganoensis TaxID=150025 RepID=A0A853DHF5_9MICO|nr:hypothetical protein [Leifsonia naganoensis]NYK08582.1 hypothetical protein [Leifsonia naganoensis]
MIAQDLEDERLFIESFRVHSTATVAHTARYTQASVDVIYDAIARGDIATIRLGRKILVLVRPLLASLGEID